MRQWSEKQNLPDIYSVQSKAQHKLAESKSISWLELGTQVLAQSLESTRETHKQRVQLDCSIFNLLCVGWKMFSSSQWTVGISRMCVCSSRGVWATEIELSRVRERERKSERAKVGRTFRPTKGSFCRRPLWVEGITGSVNTFALAPIELSLWLLLLSACFDRNGPNWLAWQHTHKLGLKRHTNRRTTERVLLVPGRKKSWISKRERTLC